MVCFHSLNLRFLRRLTETGLPTPRATPADPRANPQHHPSSPSAPSPSAARFQPSHPHPPGQQNRSYSLPQPVSPGNVSPKSHPAIQWSNSQPPSGAYRQGDVSTSSIELFWGVLFDQNDRPTKRWEQVASGIGQYIVSNCPSESWR